MPLSTSVLNALAKLLRREAPEQADLAREALRRTAATSREHSVVGPVDAPSANVIVRGEEGSVMPSARDRLNALLSNRSVLDMHTHPPASSRNAPEAFGVRPSGEDLAYFRDNYGSQVRSAPGRELRSLIAQPPSLEQRAPGAYSFFATDRPLAVFDPKAADAARYELQRGAARGRFGSVMSDPAFRDYFDYGGDMADLLNDASALFLLRRRADQGLGRHELMLGGRRLTPHRESTEQRFFDMMSPEAVELLREKKLARGGLAQLRAARC